MFGKNPVRKSWLDEAGRLAVQSIFPTIQGEGPFAGRPAIFIRLAGCNLRCWFCDTDFESNIDNIKSVEEILEEVRMQQIEADLIVLTGGEPLRQNIVPLIEGLSRNGFLTQIETAGTIWVPGLEALVESGAVHIVCSPKTARIAPQIGEHCRDFKYIIEAPLDPKDAPDDGIPYAQTQDKDAETGAKLASPTHTSTIWVQPCDVGSPSINLRNAQYCAKIAMEFGYRVSLQTHKMLGIE